MDANTGYAVFKKRRWLQGSVSNMISLVIRVAIARYLHRHSTARHCQISLSQNLLQSAYAKGPGSEEVEEFASTSDELVWVEVLTVGTSGLAV